MPKASLERFKPLRANWESVVRCAFSRLEFRPWMAERPRSSRRPVYENVDDGQYLDRLQASFAEFGDIPSISIAVPRPPRPLELGGGGTKTIPQPE